MRKEQRDFILNKLRTAVAERLTKETKLRPVGYTADEVVALLEAKGFKVRDKYYALRCLDLPLTEEHTANAEYLSSLKKELNAEISAMETALMLNRDPDAVTLLEAALVRIRG